jgi:hypothetical protein
VSARATAYPQVLTSWVGGVRVVTETLTLPALSPLGTAGSMTLVNGQQVSYQAPT